jgi:hypothetical protein
MEEEIKEIKELLNALDDMAQDSDPNLGLPLGNIGPFCKEKELIDIVQCWMKKHDIKCVKL